MKKSISLFFSVIVLASSAYSVNTASIESIRSRTATSGAELSDSDIAEIAKFWQTAMDQMLLAETSQEVVDVRRQLEKQEGTEHLSYYAAAYITQAQKSIQTAFENTTHIEDTQQRQIINRNLMILTGNLKSPKLASLAIDRLDFDDSVVQYWAVKSLTQPAVVNQLTDEVTQDETQTATILNALKGLVTRGTSPEIRHMVVRFCMSFDSPTAQEILLLIASKRVEAYQQWNVGDVQPDVQLLAALGGSAMLKQDPQIKQNFGRAFAELFAMAIQRYWMGVQMLSDDEIDQMKTVIAATDQNVLEKTMGIRTGILQAIRTSNIPVLKREFETLLGNRIRQGKLAESLNFNYGKDTAGKTLTAPPELSPMPVDQTENTD